MRLAGQRPPHAARVALVLAAVAVCFAASDTYVVVLALPNMLQSLGMDLTQLQRAAPIVSGFLLGYVAMLPLIGRVADLRGRVPVLTATLIVFALGSLITALSADLNTLVAGRFLQGLGGGGLVPATLALVADIYPVERRAVPLGIVSAVQEVGAVLGPLYGAVVLAVSHWQTIFWINLAVGLVLAAAIATGRSRRPEPARRRTPDPIGLVLLLLALAGLVLTLAQPPSLTTDVVLGWPFVPLVGTTVWSAPLTIVTVVLALLLVWRCLAARHPLVDLRGWAGSLRRADPIGAFLLAGALACVILGFATADPSHSAISTSTWWWLAGALVFAVAFTAYLRRASAPLVPPGTLAQRPAWAGVLVSFLAGSALVAALVEIPTLARLTVYPDSQLGAALVLVRLLVAVPIGAVVGGVLTRRLGASPVGAGGMLLAAVCLWWMSTWGADSLGGAMATVPLVLGGLGFGLALAPVNSAVLAATEASVHGLASALVVVARMMGMLVGVSVLTELGLRQYYASVGALPKATTVCGHGLTGCSKYNHMLQGAVIEQVSVIFIGAAVCAALAGLLSSLLGRTRSVALPA